MQQDWLARTHTHAFLQWVDTQFRLKDTNICVLLKRKMTCAWMFLMAQQLLPTQFIFSLFLFLNLVFSARLSVDGTTSWRTGERCLWNHPRWHMFLRFFYNHAIYLSFIMSDVVSSSFLYSSSAPLLWFWWETTVLYLNLGFRARV